MKAPKLSQFELEMHDTWFVTGIYFGYPVCCVNSFCDTPLTQRNLTKEQKDVHNNNGFIPCKSCAKKVYAGENTIEGLITDRACSTPYPESGPDEERRTFVYQVLSPKAEYSF